ncbi:hypothetical protein [Litoribacter populi]|uniref:hypothetical protein n=1 Tax=Litoribacter populi TaxID=2598460 RepID=UPI00117FCCFD|nr:hypothetical protein [Litoribacter populi]
MLPSAGSPLGEKLSFSAGPPNYNPHLDHEWHQYEQLEWTEEKTEVEGFWELVKEKGGLETGYI